MNVSRQRVPPSSLMLQSTEAWRRARSASFQIPKTSYDTKMRDLSLTSECEKEWGIELESG